MRFPVTPQGFNTVYVKFISVFFFFFFLFLKTVEAYGLPIFACVTVSVDSEIELSNQKISFDFMFHFSLLWISNHLRRAKLSKWVF